MPGSEPTAEGLAQLLIVKPKILGISVGKDPVVYELWLFYLPSTDPCDCHGVYG